jgi:hypothetical protein
MQQRGISESTVNDVISESRPFQYFHDGGEKIGFYCNRTLVVAAGDMIVTVITNVSESYVRGLKERKR